MDPNSGEIPHFLKISSLQPMMDIGYRNSGVLTLLPMGHLGAVNGLLKMNIQAIYDSGIRDSSQWTLLLKEIIIFLSLARLDIRI